MNKRMNKSEWKYLEYFCEILDNQRVPIKEEKRKPGNYSYFGANGIQGYIDDYIFDEDLVLLAEDGGNFGSKERPIAYKVTGKCWVNNHAHVLRPKSNISIDYLCYSLMFYDVSKLITGTTRAKLNKSAMKKMQIRLLTLKEQHQIASTLDKAAELVALRKQQLEELDALAQSVFYNLFGDPVKNEKGWEISNIGNLCTVGTGGTPDRKNLEANYNGNIPWVKTTEVQNCSIFDTEEYITEEALRNSNCKIYPIGTILLAMYGQGKTRGQVARLKLKAATNQACAAILPTDLINMDYLYSFLKLNYQEIRALGRGGNQENLNLSLVKAIPIPLPPISLQNRFAAIIEKIEAQKADVRKALQESEDLFQRLMQESFTPQQ